MTTYSDAEGRKHIQSQRGGNLPLPAIVEVAVSVGSKHASVTMHIDQDGEITFGTSLGLGDDEDGDDDDA